VSGADSFASVEALAEGVIRVVNASMESALRRVSVERGHDPRAFTLLAFGGAGPLHACDLAAALGVRRVLVPNAPGALSALGILDADLRREFSRTVMLAPGDPHLTRIFRQLETKARNTFRAEGAMPQLSRSADLRYQGQGFELRVDWSADALNRFHRLHARTYGYANPSRAVEIVTLRILAVSRSKRPRQTPASTRRGSGSQAKIGAHRLFENGKWRRAALYDRARLKAGDRIAGPALIVELSATTYVPSGWTSTVDAFENLFLARGANPGDRR
jgi:N-methylhydantoinase A